MKCPACGRFMKAGGRFTNDHLDSWEETWRCSLPHDDDLGSAWSTDRQNGDSNA